VRDALMMMKERGVKSLVVEKRHSGDAYGLIAYRDVARSVIAEDGDIDLLNVYDIAQKPALQVSQHLDVRYLARLMIQYSVKSVLVIDNNELAGLSSPTPTSSASLIDRAVGGR
jgi:CBS domain-containing protein